MEAVYVGVDVAGARNTWVAGLAEGEEGLEVAWAPQLCSLAAIVATCKEKPVVAAAIDGHLTMALAAETGFRASDRQLRALLPRGCRNWVSSLNSLMAVPVRGQLLAEHLAPLVGTVLETHPRASLLFALGGGVEGAARAYKDGGETGARAIATLWAGWAARFGISIDEAPRTDGALDALVCATTGYVYHRNPGVLLRLQEEDSVRGWGPFYVMAKVDDA
jgi:predicted nuclease with RNAse H fold